MAAEWAPPGGTISVVAANATQVLAVVGGSCLVLLQVAPGALTEVASKQLGYEITCLDISPLQGMLNSDIPAPRINCMAYYCVVHLSQHASQVNKAPTLQPWARGTCVCVWWRYHRSQWRQSSLQGGTSSRAACCWPIARAAATCCVAWEMAPLSPTALMQPQVCGGVGFPDWLSCAVRVVVHANRSSDVRRPARNIGSLLPALSRPTCM